MKVRGLFAPPPDSNGATQDSAPITIAGKSFTALLSGVISVTNDIVHVKITDVSTADDSLPSLVTQQLKGLAQTLTFNARIPALPYNLQLNSVHATSGGISISATATHVVLGS